GRAPGRHRLQRRWLRRLGGEARLFRRLFRQLLVGLDPKFGAQASGVARNPAPAGGVDADRGEGRAVGVAPFGGRERREGKRREGAAGRAVQLRRWRPVLGGKDSLRDAFAGRASGHAELVAGCVLKRGGGGVFALQRALRGFWRGVGQGFAIPVHDRAVG